MTGKCDCLNECGDEASVAAGTVAKCARYDQVQHDMWQRRTAASLQNCMTLAARDVLRERRRQIEVEGWTPEHDDEHSDGGMAVAAACYATSNHPHIGGLKARSMWGWTGWADRWFKPTTDRRNLVKAAALLLAEIERMDRVTGGHP